MLVILPPASPLLVVLPPLPSHRCQTVQTHPTSTAPSDQHIKVGQNPNVLTLVHLPPSGQADPSREASVQVAALGIAQGRPSKQPALAFICLKMNSEEKETSKAEFVLRESLLMAEVSTYMEVPAW